MKNKTKLISVVMPTYNRGYCIMDAVNSVLNQKNIFPYEIIVVDDGSTDSTPELFKKDNSNIKYYRLKKNSGVNAARNYGIKKAEGKYILFLDSDDLLKNNTFEIINEHLPKMERVNFLKTVEKIKNKSMSKMSIEGHYDYKEWLKKDKIRGEFLPLVRQDVFKKYLFDEDRFCFESFFWNKVIKEYGVYGINDVGRLYTLGQDNISKKLTDKKYSKKRFLDYKIFLDTFEKDYKGLKLIKELGALYLKVAFYAGLSGNLRDSRKFAILAMRNKQIAGGILLIIFSYLRRIFV